MASEKANAADVLNQIRKNVGSAVNSARKSKNPNIPLDVPPGDYYAQLRKIVLMKSQKGTPMIGFFLVLQCGKEGEVDYEKDGETKSIAGQQARIWFWLEDSETTGTTAAENLERVYWTIQSLGHETDNLFLSEHDDGYDSGNESHVLFVDYMTWINDNKPYCVVEVGEGKKKPVKKFVNIIAPAAEDQLVALGIHPIEAPADAEPEATEEVTHVEPEADAEPEAPAEYETVTVPAPRTAKPSAPKAAPAKPAVPAKAGPKAPGRK